MIEDYRKARKRGMKEVGKAQARGRDPFPPSLDELTWGCRFARETSLGCVEIPLELVVGTKTKGRQHAFSYGFMPLEEEGTEFAAKWSNLYDIQVDEGFRDPVVVYECLQQFYVQEGNKRVSVARYLGMPAILAQVTRAVPVAADGMGAALARYEEFERFYAVVPVYDIVLSRKRGYAQLADLMGRDLDTPWPETDVRRLKSLFYAFGKAYTKLGGNKLAYKTSDAFLLYLQTYVREGSEGLSQPVVSERVKHMWNAFVVASQPDPVAYLTDPALSKAGIVTKVVAKVKSVASGEDEGDVADVGFPDTGLGREGA